VSAGRVRAGVTRVEQSVNASAAVVWRILADGWLYPLWVVGATRMREVEEEWPAVGAKLYHSVGVWPLTLDDHTEVLGVEEGRRLTLRARGWPGGEAEVTVEIEDRGATSLVSITEDLVGGPVRLVPRPMRSAVLRKRNREALRRLAWLAERRG
jgi:uncharacterized protein YndB with AHSA1/START domain